MRYKDQEFLHFRPYPVNVQECEAKAFQQLARRLEKMNLGTDRQLVGPDCYHVRIFKSQIWEADPQLMGPPRPLKRLKTCDVTVDCVSAFQFFGGAAN